MSSADKNRPEDAPIGLIPVDAIYSPVKKVSYDVQPTREGQVLDYDKLTLKVETDGSVTPDDAVAYAARIIQDQLGDLRELRRAGSRRASSPRTTGSSSTRSCSRKSTSSSCRCAPPTA